MRLKRLSIVLLLLVGVSTVGYSATPQLTNVSVAGQGNTSTVSLQTSGGFTHNEYRPADHLLLVDLVGVSAGKFDERKRTLQVPGIKSYHVVSYAGAGGVPIARVELEVESRAEVRINPNRNGLDVEIIASGEATAASAAPATPPAQAAFAESAPPAQPTAAPAELGSSASTSPVPASSKPVQVTNLAVARNPNGVVIEVSANGPLNPRTMKLKGPDRIVIDLPNAILARVPRNVPVNASGVIAVRTGRFQANPPVTRLVLDLSAAGDFDLSTENNRLLVSVPPARHAASSQSAAASNQEMAVAQLKPVAATEQAVPPAVPAAENAAGEATAAPSQTSSAAFADLRPPESNEKVTNSSDATLAGPDAIGVKDGKSAQPDGAASSATPPGVATPAAATEVVGQSGNQAAKDLVIVEPKVQDHVSEKDPNLQSSSPASAPAAAVAAQNAGATQVGGTQPNKAVNFAAEQQQGAESTSAARYTGEPISVNLKDVDLKDFFRLIHEISGLNIVLDPSVSGSLTLVLDDVPWDQALDIVLKNNGLDRELDGNVLRIATVQTLRKEADAHRQQIEAKALAVDKVTVTRFLSYAHAKDIAPTLKKLLSSRGDIVTDERTNALIINDIPSVIQPIDRLIAQLDRKTMEVEIEARVVAATRRFAREIGTQIGFGWGNSATAVGGAGSVGASPIGNSATNVPYFTMPAINGATGRAIPLFSNLGLNAPTSGVSIGNIGGVYRVDAIITAAESRGLVKVLSRPRVITQNNIQAIVKQGQRIPITTAAQLNGPPTVAYIEAVLRLTVTPQITVEGTIFLNVDIENTTPDFSNRINGNPVFLTQQTTTQVLVTNGGTVVIGGVVQAQNSLNITQVPLLGSIPMLGNLFKHRGVDTSTAELIFFITPRIVET